MAKLSLKWGQQRAGPQRRLPVKVTIQRVMGGGPTMQSKFRACVMSGARKNAGECAEASNPKNALAEAFEKQARRLRKRPAGAFKGLVSKRKHRRRR